MGATTTEGTGPGSVERAWPRIQNNIKPENTTNYRLSPILDLTNFGGSLLCGTMHPRGSDAEALLWADASTEYLGLWYGGQINSEPGYGPDVSVTIGNKSLDDNIGTSWDDGPQVNIDIGEVNWHFDGSGTMNIPGDIKDSNNHEIWIKISTLKTLAAGAADFAAFKSAIAAL